MATPKKYRIDAHRIQSNKLLATLPAHSMARLYPHLKFVHLPLDKVLYEPGEEKHYAYFPTDAIVSLQSVMEDGASAEISIIGNEGVLGLSVFLGGHTTTYRTVTQHAGGAFCVPGHILQAELEHDGMLTEILLYYIQVLMTQIGQFAVCNRHHTINQQVCRRLLMLLDRLPHNSLEMTQETMAHMLGVRREGVTEVAGKLQKVGAISYSRGKIVVLDRAMLECTCCECYAIVKKESDRLLSRMSTEPVAASHGH